MQEAQSCKDWAIEIFSDAKFKLHKWHSNVPQLEGGIDEQDNELTYAKQQLLQPMDVQASLSSLGWDKAKNEVRVRFPTGNVEPTKGGVLCKLAKIYDPLGLVSLLSLKEKLIFGCV